MLLRSFLVSVLLGFLSAPGARALPKPQSSAPVLLEVQHSQALDLFVLMDSLSNWRPGWTQEQYPSFWKARFGSLSEEDQRFIERYAAFRRRTFQDPDEAQQDSATAPEGLFIRQSTLIVTNDPLAEHFRRSFSWKAAFDDLPRRFGQVDGLMLQAFYSHFRPEWETVLAEAQSLDTVAAAVRKQLEGPATALYINRVQHFYGTSVSGTYPVYIVWWPSADSTAGKARSGSLYLQINPKDTSDIAELSTIVFHEFAHFISAHVTKERKATLSKVYLKTCPVPTETNYLAYLEEPLAIAVGNEGYADFVSHKPLGLEDPWYFDPRSDLLAKLIWPAVRDELETYRPLSLETVSLTASFCVRIREASHAM